MELVRALLALAVATSCGATLALVGGATASGTLTWAAAGTLAATAPAVLATVLPRAPDGIEWIRYRSFLCAPLLALSAHLLSTLDVFVVAWGAAPWFFLPLYLLEEANLVAYPVGSGAFMLQRMLFYAAVRAHAVAAERHLGAPALVSRTLLLGLGTVETAYMAVRGTAQPPKLWYSFPIKSLDFASYALVKSAWLLCLPLLEESVVAALSA